MLLAHIHYGGCMKRLEGKIAVITGATGGIGAASARRLAAEGAKLVLADINVEGVEKTAEQIRAAGGECFVHHLDLADENSIEALIAAAIEKYGRIDVLFNNAADTRPATMVKDAAIAFMDSEIWDGIFAINTRGKMLMRKYTIRSEESRVGKECVRTVRSRWS